MCRGTFVLQGMRLYRPPCVNALGFALSSCTTLTDADGSSCYVVTQKKDIKRQKQRLDALKKEHQEEQERARAAARERVLQEFEKGQLGLGPSATSTTNGADIQDGEYSVV